MSDKNTLYSLAYGLDNEIAPMGGNVARMVRFLARELYDLKYGEEH